MPHTLPSRRPWLFPVKRIEDRHRFSTLAVCHVLIHPIALATLTSNIDWLQPHHKWPGLACIGKVTRTRETAVKTEVETAYYLLSAALTAERFNAVVRSHWGMKTRLHWRLDVIMNEDQDRNRMDNSPYNLAILRHMALNVMQKERSNGSLRGKFKRAAWNDVYLRRLLAMF